MTPEIKQALALLASNPEILDQLATMTAPATTTAPAEDDELFPSVAPVTNEPAIITLTPLEADVNAVATNIINGNANFKAEILANKDNNIKLVKAKLLSAMSAIRTKYNDGKNINSNSVNKLAWACINVAEGTDTSSLSI